MGKFLSDFKEFAMKGNVVDMAVGVIVGGAFGKIVSSLVNDIIMPVITVCTGGDGFANLKYVIKPAQEAVGDVAAMEEVSNLNHIYQQFYPQIYLSQLDKNMVGHRNKRICNQLDLLFHHL